MATAITKRQRATYELLKANTMEGRWTSKREIVNNYPFDPNIRVDGYILNDRSHDICSTIWTDVNALNFNPEIEKIIIRDNKNNFKLAENEEETNKFTQPIIEKAVRALQRAYNAKRKAKNDGAGKLLGVRLDPIVDDSKARRFVESFVNAKVNELFPNYRMFEALTGNFIIIDGPHHKISFTKEPEKASIFCGCDEEEFKQRCEMIKHDFQLGEIEFRRSLLTKGIIQEA